MDKKINITVSNVIDYNKIHWWLMLLLVTLGSSILWMLFKMSWLILLVAILIVLTVRNLFKLNIQLKANSITIDKTFAGIPYFRISQTFSKVFFFENEAKYIFQNTPNDLMLIKKTDQLELIKNAKIYRLGNKIEAEALYQSMKKYVNKLNIKIYYLSTMPISVSGK